MIRIVLLILIVLLLLRVHVLDAQRIIISELMEYALQLIHFAKPLIQPTETVFPAINPISSAVEPVSLTLMDQMINALLGSKVSVLHVHPAPSWMRLVNANRLALIVILTVQQLEIVQVAIQVSHSVKENVQFLLQRLVALSTILRVNAQNVVREVISAMDHATLLIPNVLLLIFLLLAAQLVILATRFSMEFARSQK